MRRLRIAHLSIALGLSGARARTQEKIVEEKDHEALQLGVEFESVVIVTALADDHGLVREALEAVVERELAGAVVLEPSVPPAVGFELVLVVPTAVTPADLTELRQALVLGLHHREVMTAELVVELLAE